MSTNIKQLTVGLTLNTDNFTQKMKVVNQQLKTLKTGYKSASADSKSFDNSFVGLTNRITNIKAQIDTYNTKLELVSSKLEEARTKNALLEKTMKEAETTYKTNKEALDQLQKEGKEGTEEFESLKKVVEANEKAMKGAEKAYLNNASSLERLEREADELKSSITALETEFNQCSDKLKTLGKESESSASKLKKLDSELALSESKFKLLRAELGQNVSETKKLQLQSQELAEKERILSQKTDIYKEAVKKTTTTLQKHETSLKEVKGAITQTNYELVKAKQKYGENSVEVQQLQQKLLVLKDKEMVLKGAIAQTNTELNKNQIELNQSQAELKETANQIANVTTKLKGMGWSTASKNLNSFATKLNALGNGLKTVGRNLSLYITTPLLSLGVLATKTAVSFEQSITKTGALANATAEEFELLSNTAKKMGENIAGASATDVADSFGYLALAGYDVNDMLSAVEPNIKAAIAWGADMATNTDGVTDSLSALGMTAEDTTRYLDALTTAQNNANTTGQELLEAYIGAGGMFRDWNTPLAESTALLGILANRGIKGKFIAPCYSNVA